MRWYGAASVPSGNNPSSSRYISNTPLAPDAEIATATASVEISQAPEVTAAAEAETASATAAAAETTAESSASKGGKMRAQKQTAGSWIKAHMPYIRSHKSAVTAAAVQPGSSVLETPERTVAAAAAAEDVPSLTAAIAAVEQALTGRVSPSGRVIAPGGRVSPADSTHSTDSAAAHAAAASMARAAVEAVVARAAAEAALEEVAQEQKMRQSASAILVGAGGGFVNAERDSADDARLLQQIRSALAAGSSGALPEVVTAGGAAVMTPDSGGGKVALEEYMRPPASISIDAPAEKVRILPSFASALASCCCGQGAMCGPATCCCCKMLPRLLHFENETLLHPECRSAVTAALM